MENIKIENNFNVNINKLLDSIVDLDPDDEQYTVRLEHINKLVTSKDTFENDERTRYQVDSDQEFKIEFNKIEFRQTIINTLASGAMSLICIGAMMLFEKNNVFSSKAFSWLPKNK